MATTLDQQREQQARARQAAQWRLVAAATCAALADTVAPNWIPSDDTPGMTHYAQLLMTTGRNLLVFMGLLFVGAYAYALSAVRLALAAAGWMRPANRGWERLNRWAAYSFGCYMTAVVAYVLVHLIIPVTLDGAWRGWLDVASILLYLTPIVPAFWFAFMAAGAAATTGARVFWNTVVLVVGAHAAMLTGMWPLLAGWAGALAGS
jgi:hypothetical protein